MMQRLSRPPAASGLWFSLLMNNTWDWFSSCVLARPLVHFLVWQQATGEKSLVPPVMKVGFEFVTSAQKLGVKLASAQSYKLFAASRLWISSVLCCVRAYIHWLTSCVHAHVGHCHAGSFLSQAHSVLCSFPCMYTIISSQYFSPVPLSQESGVWMNPQLWERGEEHCFFLELGVERWLLWWCSACGAHMEQNRIGGEIMIVWCSRGGESEERYWVIRYSEAGSLSNCTSAKMGKARAWWLMLVPAPDWLLHHGNREAPLPDVFRKASRCAHIMVCVLRRTHSHYWLQQLIQFRWGSDSGHWLFDLLILV